MEWRIGSRRLSTSIATFRIHTLTIETMTNPMTPNKQTVQQYMDAFAKNDHAGVLACLTDDIVWIVPGYFHIVGKEAFDKEIENDAFVGNPALRLSRMTEENNIVVAEGSVRSTYRNGGVMNAVFCDVFEMENAKIKRVTSYLMEIKA